MSASTMYCLQGAHEVFIFMSPRSNDPLQTWAPRPLSKDFSFLTQIFAQRSKYRLSCNIESHMHSPLHTCFILPLSCIYKFHVEVSIWTMIHPLCNSKFHQYSCSILSILTDDQHSSWARNLALPSRATRVGSVVRPHPSRGHGCPSRSVTTITFLLCWPSSKTRLHILRVLKNLGVQCARCSCNMNNPTSTVCLEFKWAFLCMTIRLSNAGLTLGLTGPTTHYYKCYKYFWAPSPTVIMFDKNYDAFTMNYDVITSNYAVFVRKNRRNSAYHTLPFYDKILRLLRRFTYRLRTVHYKLLQLQKATTITSNYDAVFH